MARKHSSSVRSSRAPIAGLRFRHEAGLAPIIEMGARPYLPAVGRFLTIDPVQGGSANEYDYVNQDPINGFDLAGTIGCGICHRVAHAVARTTRHTVTRAHHAVSRVYRAHVRAFKYGAKFAQHHWRQATYLAAAGVCIAASAGACGAAIFAGFALRTLGTATTHGWAGTNAIRADALVTMFTLMGPVAAAGGMEEAAAGAGIADYKAPLLLRMASSSDGIACGASRRC